MDSITQVSLAIMEVALTATEAVMETTQAANLSAIINEKQMLSLRTVSEVHATRTTLARRNV